MESLGAAPQSRGFVLLDVFRTPNGAATGPGRLIEQVISSTFAVIGASNDGTGEGPTAASLALRDQFAESEMDLDVFVVRMDRQLSRDSAVTAHLVLPSDGGQDLAHRRCLRLQRQKLQPRARPACASACRVNRPPANGRPCYDRHRNQCCGSVASHSCCFNRRSRSAFVGGATTSGPRFIGGATSGTDRGAAADTRERGQAADPDGTYAHGILCGADRRKVRTRDPGCRPSLSIRDQCRRDWSPDHRTGNQTPMRRVPAAPAPRDDAAYCAALSALYRRYSAAPAKAISQKRRRRWRWTNAPGAIRQAASRS